MNTETITIEKMQSENIAAVSRIFMRELDGSFASHLGFHYLQKLYFPFLLNYPGAIALIAKVNNQPAGFILGAKMTGFYGDMIKRSLFLFLWFIIVCFLKKPFITLREVINITRVSKSDPEMSESASVAELLYMAVNSDFQRRNIGSLLVKDFETKLIERGYEKCLVQTMENTPHAQNFYRKNNFGEVKRGEGRVWFIKNLT